MDSIQLTTPSGVYMGPLGTPDYMPPEAYDGSFDGKKIIDKSWDGFSLSVIFYQILLGIHPYAASPNSLLVHNGSLSDSIKLRMYVHGKRRSDLSVIPQPHDFIKKLPKAIVDHFTSAFDSDKPDDRPTPKQWGEAFVEVINPSVITKSRRVQPAKSATTAIRPIVLVEKAEVTPTLSPVMEIMIVPTAAPVVLPASTVDNPIYETPVSQMTENALVPSNARVLKIESTPLPCSEVIPPLPVVNNFRGKKKIQTLSKMNSPSEAPHIERKDIINNLKTNLTAFSNHLWPTIQSVGKSLLWIMVSIIKICLYIFVIIFILKRFFRI
jgi:serine/threonine protein kinase